MSCSRRLFLSMLATSGLLPVTAFARGLAADVVVVGSGAAGLAAALSASEKGASVVVLEKMPTIGGNTLVSSGFFNAPDPQRQKPAAASEAMSATAMPAMPAAQPRCAVSCLESPASARMNSSAETRYAM